MDEGMDLLHGLLPGQSQQAIYSGSDAEYKRKEPETVHGVGYRTMF